MMIFPLSKPNSSILIFRIFHLFNMVSNKLSRQMSFHALVKYIVRLRIIEKTVCFLSAPSEYFAKSEA
jgi:hypothetical protein